MKNITKTHTIVINGKKIHGNCNSVFCISNGKMFDSQKEAAKNCNVSTSGVSLVCRGLQRCAKGLRFCLASDMSAHFEEIAQNMSKLYDENVEKEKALVEIHKEVEKDAQMFIKVMNDKIKALVG